MLGLEVQLVGLQVVGRLLLEPVSLLVRKLRLERARDLEGHVGLNREDVGEVAIVGLGPAVAIGPGVDELRDDPDPAPRPPDASFEQGADIEGEPDLAQVPVATLEPHHRATPDHPQRADLRELRDHVLGNPVGEEFVFGIGAHVGEGEDRDRRDPRGLRG
jgi:hypothetical protein